MGHQRHGCPPPSAAAPPPALRLPLPALRLPLQRCGSPPPPSAAAPPTALRARSTNLVQLSTVSLCAASDDGWVSGTTESSRHHLPVISVTYRWCQHVECRHVLPSLMQKNFICGANELLAPPPPPPVLALVCMRY